MTESERIARIEELIAAIGKAGRDPHLRQKAVALLEQLVRDKVTVGIALIPAEGKPAQERLAMVENGGHDLMMAFPDPVEALAALFPAGEVEMMTVAFGTLLDWLLGSPAAGIVLPSGKLADPENVQMVAIDRHMAKDALGK